MPPRQNKRIKTSGATLVAPRLVVGIDLGTTNSSVSFARADEPDRMQSIEHYPEDPSPESHSVSANQVPTLIRYDQTSNVVQGTTSVRWGYEVSTAGLPFSDETSPAARHTIPRMKLIFDKSDITAQFRADELEPRIQALIHSKTVEKSLDVVTDYLEALLNHTKEQLKLLDMLKDDITIELVLCVPPQWTATACMDMHTALRQAAIKTGFGVVGKDEIQRLEHFFMVSEPEAAAAYVLSKNHILVSIAFVIINCL